MSGKLEPGLWCGAMAEAMDLDEAEERHHAAIDDDADDDDDPVVKTLDVFLSQNLPGVRDSAGRSDGLFLFQYPLRPKWRPLDDGWKLDKVSYRPFNEMVELELLAGEEGDEFRHKLVSSKVEPKTSFAVGLLRGDQLHLTPLQSMLQFRPRFDWKDEEDAAQKKANTSGSSGAKAAADDAVMEDAGSGSDGEAMPAPVVQVKVSKRESDKAKEIRRSSHAYLREQEEKEPWQSVQLLGPESPESQELLESMVSSSGRDINFSVTCDEYLNSLDATSRSRAGHDLVPPRATGQLSREELIRMPLSDQVRSLMVAAQVLQLERLEELIPGPSPAGSGGGASAQRRLVILEQLPRHAVVVQGVWVVKSEHMYKDDAKNQAQVDGLRRCRNHVLSCFRHNLRVSASSLRRELTRDVTPAELERMLFQVAVRKEGCWEFKIPPDGTLAARFPEVHATQEAAWLECEAALSAAAAAKSAGKPSKGRNSGGGGGGGGMQSPRGERAGGKAAGGGAVTGAGGAGGGGAGGGASRAVVASLVRADAAVSGKGDGGAGGGAALVLPSSTYTQLKSAVTNALKQSGVLPLEGLLQRLREHPTAAVAALAADAEKVFSFATCLCLCLRLRLRLRLRLCVPAVFLSFRGNSLAVFSYLGKLCFSLAVLFSICMSVCLSGRLPVSVSVSGSDADSVSDYLPKSVCHCTISLSHSPVLCPRLLLPVPLTSHTL